MIRKLSLKDCWNYAKNDLVPEARSFKKIFNAFISRKACNVVFSQKNRKLNLLDKFEIIFWNYLEFYSRNLRNKFLK